MLKHVVMWKVKEENKQQSMEQMKDMLEALPAKISEIKGLEVGFNENGDKYDVILITEFENDRDLKIYDGHPEHQKVRAFIRSVVEERAVVDYN